MDREYLDRVAGELPVDYVDLCIFFHPTANRGRVQIIRYRDQGYGEPDVQILHESEIGPFAFRDEVNRHVQHFVALAANMLGWPE